MYQATWGEIFNSSSSSAVSCFGILASTFAGFLSQLHFVRGRHSKFAVPIHQLAGGLFLNRYPRRFGIRDTAVVIFLLANNPETLPLLNGNRPARPCLAHSTERFPVKLFQKVKRHKILHNVIPHLTRNGIEVWRLRRLDTL